MINQHVQAGNKNSLSFPGKHLRSRVFGNFEWICALIVFGVIGFALIEGWSIADGLYMTIITMSTVGYGETNDLTPVGRVFTTLLILLSILGMTFWTAQITTTFVSGELTGKYSARRTKKVIDSLTDHAIIFGSGTMATTIMSRLGVTGRSCVIIDNNVLALETLRKQYANVLVVDADPKCELALSDANIFAASHVIATLESDFDNLLIAMTVKEFDPDKIVIARSNDPRVASRMIKIGVDHVVCPFQLSGDHVADLVNGDKEMDNPIKL